MKTKSLSSLFAIALALVACNKNETEPAFTPELKLDKTEKISAPAAGGSVNLKVTANVSWTVTSNDNTVATVNPASKEITDKKSAETQVTVTINENKTTEARNATLTFKAEGCNDIVVEIEQAAAEVADVFEVLDSTGEKPAPSSFDVAFAGETVVVYVNSNINWTATSSAATWLTATPASFNAESREPEPTAVSIKATTNTGAARNATITFSAAGQQDVVITIKQPVAPTLKITVEDDYITYKGAYVLVTPSDETLKYYSVLVDKKYYDELIGKGATDDLLPAVFAKANAEYYEMTIQEFLKIVLLSGEDYYDYTDLDPETEYVFLTQYMDGDGTPLSSAFKATFTTKKKPETDPEYTKFIGTWKLNHDRYDYNERTESIELGGTGSWTAVIEEDLVNDSYYVSFPDNNDQVSPIYEGEYDRFPMMFQKQEDMSILGLPFFYYGDLGFVWSFRGLDGYYAMAFVGFYLDSDENLEGVIFTWKDDTTLIPIYPTEPFVMTTGIISEEDESMKGRYSDYIRPTSMERVAPTSPSVRMTSARTTDKHLGIKAARHTKKAGKANIKGWSYKKIQSRANYVELP